jgi:hypothetical protein
MKVEIEWSPSVAAQPRIYGQSAGHLSPFSPSFPSTIFLFISTTTPWGQIGELLATWAGRLATYLGRQATPWLPDKGLPRGASSFIPQANKQPQISGILL